MGFVEEIIQVAIEVKAKMEKLYMHTTVKTQEKKKTDAKIDI